MPTGYFAGSSNQRTDERKLSHYLSVACWNDIMMSCLLLEVTLVATVGVEASGVESGLSERCQNSGTNQTVTTNTYINIG